MDVHERVIGPLASTIDVRNMEDLAKIAEQQNTMILHTTFNYMDYYLVQGNGMTYRYGISSGKRDIIEVEKPLYQDIRNYMRTSHAKIAEPVNEVISMDTLDTHEIETPSAEPAEKTMLRYSGNINKSQSRTEAL